MNSLPTPDQTTRPPWSVDTLFERSQDLLCITDNAGYLRRVNPAWSQAMGHAQTGLPDAPLFQLVYAGDQERLHAAFADAVATGELRTVTARCPDSDGGQRLVEWQISADPGLGLVSALGRDITAHRQTEDRLRLFEAMVEQATIGMAITDLDGCCIYANETLRHTYGYGEALIGMTIPMLLRPEDRADADRHLAEIFTSGRTSLETVFVCHDGSIRPVNIAALLIRNADGAPLITAAVIRDLTDEHARAQQLHMFETLVQHMPDAVTVTNLNSQVIYTNPSFRQMIGMEGHRAALMSNDTLAHSEVERMRSEVLPALLTQKTWRGRVRHRRSDGSTFPSDSLAFVIQDAQGGTQSVAIVMRDVTEQERAEQEIAHTASLLQATLESTSDGILAVDTEGRVTNFNQQFITLWQIPAPIVATHDDTLLLQFVLDQLADPGAFIAKVRELYDEPDATSYDILTFKDGRSVERYSHPQRINGASMGRVWNFRDITDRKRAESERLSLQEQVIAAQQANLRELSTPLIPIADGVVVMPLIGSIDSTRAQQVIETLLEGVAERRAHVAILDITGVSVVDTQVANALLRAAQAVRLLGANVVLTGIKPEIAQTLVNLGTDLRGIVTRGSLQSGIAFALQQR